MARDDSAVQVATAKVGSSHGVLGEVALISFSGETEHLLKLGAVELRSPTGAHKPGKVTSCRLSGAKVLAQFDGIGDREAARALTGWEVWVIREQGSALREEEFYLSDLQGAKVIQDGHELGKICGVLSGGPADLLEVEPVGGGQSFYVPFLRQFVPVVDLDAHHVELETGLEWRVKP